MAAQARQACMEPDLERKDRSSVRGRSVSRLAGRSVSSLAQCALTWRTAQDLTLIPPNPAPIPIPIPIEPVIYWTPVIGPGNLTLFNGKMFPEWDGPAFVCGLSKKPLVWITFDGKGGATAVECRRLERIAATQADRVANAATARHGAGARVNALSSALFFQLLHVLVFDGVVELERLAVDDRLDGAQGYQRAARCHGSGSNLALGARRFRFQPQADRRLYCGAGIFAVGLDGEH